MTRFLIVTDPWETLDHALDTSLRLAEAALQLGHSVSWCDVHSIRTLGAITQLDASELHLSFSSPSGVEKSDPEVIDVMRFDRILYRTDPPVDLAYLHPLQMLVRGLGRFAKERLVNPPECLILLSEKLEGGQLGDSAPRSLCSSQKAALLGFLQSEGKAVLKPLHLAQSKGVRLLESGGTDVERTLRDATENHTRPAFLQQYLPEVKTRGETRLWFLDGKLIGSFLKHPLEGDFRVQIDQGSRLARGKLTARERAVALKIGRLLRGSGVRMAAVDLVAAKITDYNVTSPGLLRQMEKVNEQEDRKSVV